MAERLDYSVLTSFWTREEAEVAASALRADGVDAFVGNAHHAAAVWWNVVALGGLQVMVPTRRLRDAKMALRTRVAEWADVEPEDAVGRRDHWKLWVVVALAMNWMIVMLAAVAVVATWANPRKQKSTPRAR